MIKGAISALEKRRSLDAHLYKDCIEASLPLRSDSRIKQLEQAAAHNEPQRVLDSQILKAAGSSVGK